MENEDLTFIESDNTQFLDDFQTEEEQDTSIKQMLNLTKYS